MSMDQESNRLEVIWGTRLLDDGFLGIPNVIVRNYRKLGIEHGEFGFICTILTYKHDTKDPYPTEDKLAEHLNCSVPQIKKWVKSISDKGLVLVGQRKSVDKKTWGSNVYNFRPLIEKALALVGEAPLPPSNNYEIVYRRLPGIPEVSTGPRIPEVSTESTPEVSMDSAPEVYTNKSFKKTTLKNDDDNNARAHDDQDFTHQNQPKELIGEDEWSDPFTEPAQPPSTPPRPIDNFSPSDSSADVFTAQAGLTSPPSPDGQPPKTPVPNMTSDELNDIYEAVEAYMSAYTPRRYRLRQGEYSKLNDLLVSGVTVEFIGKVINDLYTEGHNPEYFAYCAKAIVHRWAIELEKQAPPKPIDWDEHKQQRRGGAAQSGERGSGGRIRRTQLGSSARTVGDSMPDRVVPAAQPGKYERFYQVYGRQGIDVGNAT